MATDRAPNLVGGDALVEPRGRGRLDGVGSGHRTR